jgi:Putative Actinobacterial Holin-X, holin superfamily III
MEQDVYSGEARPASQESLNELLKRLSEQSTQLARMEVELAKAELTQKGKQIGLGLGAFGGAGAIAFYAFGALTATLILALAQAVDGWLAALIVTVVYAAIAGALALLGKSRVEAGSPPVPERAVASSKEDVETAKRSAKEARA